MMVSVYELLRLSLATRVALREAFVDKEVFVTWLAESAQPELLQAGGPRNLIMFSNKDLMTRGIHERPLYFIWYIGLSQINRIQINQGSFLSFMSYSVMQFHSIPS